MFPRPIQKSSTPAQWLYAVALPVALLLNAALTLAQGFTEDYSSLLWLRLANGISNGLVFVQAPALVLEWLAQQQRTRLSGLVYLGLGGGQRHARHGSQPDARLEKHGWPLDAQHERHGLDGAAPGLGSE